MSADCNKSKLNYNLAKDASLHRKDASLHRKDASSHRQDASLHRQEDVKSSQDASPFIDDSPISELFEEIRGLKKSKDLEENREMIQAKFIKKFIRLKENHDFKFLITELMSELISFKLELELELELESERKSDTNIIILDIISKYISVLLTFRDKFKPAGKVVGLVPFPERFLTSLVLSDNYKTKTEEIVQLEELKLKLVERLSNLKNSLLLKSKETERNFELLTSELKKSIPPKHLIEILTFLKLEIKKIRVNFQTDGYRDRKYVESCFPLEKTSFPFSSLLEIEQSIRELILLVKEANSKPIEIKENSINISGVDFFMHRFNTLDLMKLRLGSELESLVKILEDTEFQNKKLYFLVDGSADEIIVPAEKIILLISRLKMKSNRKLYFKKTELKLSNSFGPPSEELVLELSKLKSALVSASPLLELKLIEKLIQTVQEVGEEILKSIRNEVIFSPDPNKLEIDSLKLELSSVLRLIILGLKLKVEKDHLLVSVLETALTILGEKAIKKEMMLDLWDKLDVSLNKLAVVTISGPEIKLILKSGKLIELIIKYDDRSEYRA